MLSDYTTVPPNRNSSVTTTSTLTPTNEQNQLNDIDDGVQNPNTSNFDDYEIENNFNDIEANFDESTVDINENSEIDDDLEYKSMKPISKKPHRPDPRKSKFGGTTDQSSKYAEAIRYSKKPKRPASARTGYEMNSPGIGSKIKFQNYGYDEKQAFIPKKSSMKTRSPSSLTNSQQKQQQSFPDYNYHQIQQPFQQHQSPSHNPQQNQSFLNTNFKYEMNDYKSDIWSQILVIISYIFLALSFPFSLCACIKVAQEYERAVVFRLGRIIGSGHKGPGIFFVLPCVDTYMKVDLRTVTFDVPPQEILTKDSVTVSVDAVVYFRIFNAVISVINVEDAAKSTKLLAASTLRNVLGTKSLHEILSDRETVASLIQTILLAATAPWGVQVERVEVKDVRLPVQLQRAMATEAEAAREARAKVIAAEGEKKASVALKEAAIVINQSPIAIQLRYLQTLTAIASERNSTIVFPIPLELISFFQHKQRNVEFQRQQQQYQEQHQQQQQQQQQDTIALLAPKTLFTNVTEQTSSIIHSEI